MSLIESLTSFCSDIYENYGECTYCSHPSGYCSGSCRKCSEEVNFHTGNGRSDYDCQKFMYYYVCRYSWKYCSEIMYALDTIDLDEYPEYRILSLGCGGAPDLMAFEEKNVNQKDILYRGYDINSYWKPIHDKIENYASKYLGDICFFQEDIFNVLNDEKFSQTQYNIVILEYLLSHFPDYCRQEMVDELFDGIINFVLLNRYSESPFLIIINDIDHLKVRVFFDIFINKLIRKGYSGDYFKCHFKYRNQDFGDKSFQYKTSQNCFFIPERQKKIFDCAIKCSSAQMIIIVR